jgi:predicted nucleotide-binding protein (sugar kinase/HSP70/actin superfamily)
MEKNPGFKFTVPMMIKALYAVILGDLLQKMLYKNRPYEKEKGATEKMYDKWLDICKKLVTESNYSQVKKAIFDMVKDFDTIEIDKKVKKPKVGIVGEILIKYHPFGNNYVTKILEDEGAEVILPDFMGFVKYVLENQVISNNLLKTSNVKAFGSDIAINILEGMEKTIGKALSMSDRDYLPPSNIRHLATNVKEILSNGNQTGEGWFLTAEMLEYIENDIPNVICVQPFACLPNHVVGKGVIKTIRDKFPNANIVAVDYDPGASEANQTNRIKLMLTVAKDNLKQKGKSAQESNNENK